VGFAALIAADLSTRRPCGSSQNARRRAPSRA